MHIVVILILALLLTWLVKYLDERMTFLELIFDPETLIVGMLVSGLILYGIYFGFRKGW
jgi:hypothetical protein